MIMVFFKMIFSKWQITAWYLSFDDITSKRKNKTAQNDPQNNTFFQKLFLPPQLMTIVLQLKMTAGWIS